MLDSPTGTGKWALVAGEETRRSRPSGLYSPAGPEARDQSPSEVSLPLTRLFPILLLMAPDHLPPCSPVSGLWLGVSGLVGRRELGLPVQTGETKDPSSSAIFWREGSNFQVFFLLCLSFFQRPISLVQSPADPSPGCVIHTMQRQPGWR